MTTPVFPPGWKIFPCDGKRPLIDAWPSAASDDPEQHARWHEQLPNCNWGLALGPSGLCAVDFDGREGEDAWATHELAHGLVATREHTTPRGRHLLFRGELPNSVGRLGPKLDTRGQNGFIVVPPSTVGGVSYSANDTQIADLPGWLSDLCGRRMERVPSPLEGEPVEAISLRDAGSWLDPNVPYDQWRDLVAGMGAANCPEAHAIAHEWSQGRLDRLKRYETAPPSRYTGPEAVDAVLDSMPRTPGGVGPGTVAKLARDAGWTGTLRPTASAQEVFAHLAASMRNRGPVPFRDVIARQVPPVREIISGLVEKGTVTFLSAPGGSHKSRLAVQWGLCVETATPVYGRTVERARFVYVSYEDHADEVARRAQAITRRLSLPTDNDAAFWDLSGKDSPLAIVHESGECETRPFWDALHTFLTKTPGHKFVVIDSTYNALRFAGAAKINEGAVMAGIGLLQRLCDETDSTLLVLWHPSQAGQERGDASGWSVAWHNAPRARLSVTPVRDTEDAFELKVEKRNHGAKGKPITLHWSDGALLPRTETASAEQEVQFRRAVVRVAVMAAEAAAPIQSQRRMAKWQLDELETELGRRPTDREVKDALAAALPAGALRYLRGSQHRTAGYYPPEEHRAAELAKLAKQGGRNA